MRTRWGFAPGVVQNCAESLTVSIIFPVHRLRSACSDIVRAHPWWPAGAAPPVALEAEEFRPSCPLCALPGSGDREMSGLWGQSPALCGTGRRLPRIARPAGKALPARHGLDRARDEA